MFKREIGIDEKLPLLQSTPLALQHVFAMFGATILVPILTGLNPSVALLTSGLGTLLFHFFTKGKVPAYLGSSFAFIAPIILAKQQFGVQAAMFGCIAAGLVYVVVYFVIKMIGPDFIEKYLPPVVVGPVVMIIGLSLAPTAVSNMAAKHLPTAFFTMAATIVFSIFARGFFKIIPILLGIIAGYLFAITQGLVDFRPIAEAAWFALPVSMSQYQLPAFSWGAVALIAPLAIVTMVEDLGHILVIGKVVDRDLIKNPGFDRVLLGNGLATALAGLIGGPPSTTYGENIGVLAITRVFSGRVIRYAAVIAIALSFVQKLGVAIQTIPVPVMGGICILLFGMIAAAGLRTLVDSHVDFASTRNLIIASVILILGVGGIKIPLGNFVLEGVGPATLVGIFLNIILPQEASKVKEGKAIEKAGVVEAEQTPEPCYK